MTDSVILTRATPREGSLDVAKRYREFVASSSKLDSHETIIKQNWRLERYAKNPIVLWDHRRSVPIGKGEARVEGDQLIVGVTFAENDPDAERVWNLVKQDVLRAVSVGFRPESWEIKDVGEDEWVVIYDAPELYELSVCSIGSNEDAVARAEAGSDEEEKRIRQELLGRRERARSQKEQVMAKEDKEKSGAPEERAGSVETITRAEHETLVRKLEAEKAKLEKDLALEKEANSTTASRVAKLESEARAVKLAGLVGKKFPESELEEMRELLETNPGLFDRTMEKRKELGFGIGKQVANTDTSKTRSASETEEDAQLNKRAAERVRDFGEDSYTARLRAADDLGLRS